MVIFIFSLFILSIFLFLISPLQLRVVVEHDKSDEVWIQLSLLWGLLKYKLSVTSLELSLTKIISYLNLTDKTGKVIEEKKLALEFNLEFLMELLQKFDLSLVRFLWKFKKELIPPTRCIQITWITKVGLQDAAVTAIAIGLLWNLKGLFYTILSQVKQWQIKKVELNVIPNFKEKILEVYMDCIFRFTIGHIIIAGIKLACYLLFFGLKKGSETNGRSSDRSVNENSYGKY